MLKALNQSFPKFFMVMHEFSIFQFSGDHLTFIKSDNDNLLNHLQSLTGSTTFIKTQINSGRTFSSGLPV